MEETPLSAYRTWFEGLPPEMAKELALSLMQLYPAGALQPSLITSDPTAGFLQRIQRLAQTPKQVAGMALLLSEFTEFVVLDRTDPKSWQQSEELMGFLEENQGESGLGLSGEVAEQLEEFLDSSRLRSPLRARQWQKLAESWQSLLEGPLGREQIRDWLKNTTFRGA